ncbi:MAG: DUF4304 domain-containing protein [Verrucomicrobiota bacterium]
MITNQKKLEEIIDGVLKPFGFIKRRSAWYRHYPETVLVLDLQKSDYGGQYYVNLAVSIRELNRQEYPREEHCHINIRLDRVAGDRETVHKVFDLENRTLTDDERRQHILEIIGKGSQWLEALSTLRTITWQLSKNESLRNRTTIQARRFLNINSLLPTDGNQ